MQHFLDLFSAGYLPAVGSWVQVAPASGLTTVLNAFNTLGTQAMEIFLFDEGGDTVATAERTLATHQTLRLDLATLVPASALPFEGSLWLWSHGDTAEGHLGLQAIDLDFLDRNRPDGHVMGTVHLIFDFINTLGIPPYLDLVAPRLLVGETPEGGPAYQNFLGVCHVPTTSLFDLTGPELVLTVTNEDGEELAGNQTIALPLLGSWFGDLGVLFPGLPEHLLRPGERRGYGALNVREKTSRTTGLAGMLKIVDVVSGAMLVNHLTDRSFARPAMKEQ
jgi:hypothetical protein